MSDARVVWLSVTPTVDTSAYAAGDLIGGKLSVDLSFFRDHELLALKGLVLADKAKQSAALDVLFFGADPSATTFTDNAAFDPADADLAKVIAALPLASADYLAFSDSSLVVATGIEIPLALDAADASLSLYVALISRGAPTYASAADLVLRLGVMGL